MTPYERAEADAIKALPESQIFQFIKNIDAELAGFALGIGLLVARGEINPDAPIGLRENLTHLGQLAKRRERLMSQLESLRARDSQRGVAGP